MCHLAVDNRDLITHTHTHTVLWYRFERCVFLKCLSMCYQWPAGLHLPPAAQARAAVAYCMTVSSDWKSLNVCCSLVLFSNPFWIHNAVLLNNSKSFEKRQEQAWPQCLGPDFMLRGKEESVFLRATHDIKQHVDELICIRSSACFAKEKGWIDLFDSWQWVY